MPFLKMGLTPAETVLALIAENGRTTPVSLFQIGARIPQNFSAQDISTAILDLVRDGLIEQGPGGNGWYTLTDDGVKMAAEANEASDYDRLSVPSIHPGAASLDVENGFYEIGVFPNARPVRLRLWTSLGTLPLVVSGATASGTTNVLRGLVDATSATRDVRTWVIDPGMQLSTVELNTVDRVADDHTAIMEMLGDVLEVQQTRSKILSEYGRIGWTGPVTPGGRMPLGLIVITGLHELKPHQIGRLRQISRAARKTGITIAAEVPSMVLTCFGNDMLLREYFLGGHVLRMRDVGGISPLVGNPEQIAYPPIRKEFSPGVPTAGLAYLPTGELIRTHWTPQR